MRLVSLIAIVMAMGLLASTPRHARAADVNVPDANLATAIREHLGIAAGDPITDTAMAGLYSLNIEYKNVRSLEGLQHAVNLGVLMAQKNLFSDLSPLSNLTQLYHIDVMSNPLNDISPLSNLANLERLFISGTNVSDISVFEDLPVLKWVYMGKCPVTDLTPLSTRSLLEVVLIDNLNLTNADVLQNCPELWWVVLAKNPVTDISALAGKTKLGYLFIHNCQVSDLSPLSDAPLNTLFAHNNMISDVSVLEDKTDLTEINLSGNSITDVSPLANNAGLGEGDLLNLYSNPLPEEAYATHIPEMIDRGVDVIYPNPDDFTLWQVSREVMSENCRGLELADMNNDGRLDALAASSTGGTGFYLARNVDDTPGDWTVDHYMSGEWATTIAAGDIDGDGDQDLVFPRSSSNLGWLKSESGATSFESYPIGSVELTQYACAGDFNNDGFADVALGEKRISMLRIWMNDGAGESWTRYDINAAANTHSIQVADFNSDGADDILLSTKAGLHLYTYDPLSSPAWVLHKSLTTYNPIKSAALADVTGDGIPDLLEGQGNLGGIYYYPGPEFDIRINIVQSFYAANLQAADVDDDGDPDIVACSSTDTPSLIFLENLDGIGEKWRRHPIDYRSELRALDIGNLFDDGALEVFAGSNRSFARIFATKSRPRDLIASPGADSVRLDWTPGVEEHMFSYDVHAEDSADASFAHYVNTENILLPLWVETGLGFDRERFYKISSRHEFALRSLKSAMAGARTGEVTLTMNNHSAPAGEKTTLRLSVVNALNLSPAGFHAEVVYDSSLLSFSEVLPTPITEDWTFSANSSVAGVLTIDATGGSAINEPLMGSFVNIEFDVAQDAVNGSAGAHSFNALNMYDKNNNLMFGGHVSTAMFTVREEYRPGDIDGNGWITLEDVDLITNHILGRAKLAPGSDAYTAADMNADGHVTAADLVLLLRALREDNQKSGAQPGSDFTPQAGDATGPIDLSLPRIDMAGGQSRAISLSAANLTGCAGIDLILLFDPEVLQIDSTQLRDFGSEAIAETELSDGVLRITIGSKENLLMPDPASLARITFTAIGAAGESSRLRLAAVRLYDRDGAELNWARTLNVQAGKITINSDPKTNARNWRIYE